jgi:hypothetical protein
MGGLQSALLRQMSCEVHQCAGSSAASKAAYAGAKAIRMQDAISPDRAPITSIKGVQSFLYADPVAHSCTSPRLATRTVSPSGATLTSRSLRGWGIVSVTPRYSVGAVRPGTISTIFTGPVGSLAVVKSGDCS